MAYNSDFSIIFLQFKNVKCVLISNFNHIMLYFSILSLIYLLNRNLTKNLIEDLTEKEKITIICIAII